MEKIITKEMLKEGYKQKIVHIVKNSWGEIVCQIGDNWFYFNDLTAEEFGSVEKYKKNVSEEDFLKSIYEVLTHDFITELPDEYLYYYYYLKANLK